MPEITFETIHPLVEQEDVSGHSVTVIFRCPVSGQQIRGSASVVQERGVGREVKRSIWRNMRYSLSSVVRSMFGYSVAGQIGSAVAYSAMSGAEGQGARPSEAQVKQAIVDAFKGVANQFAWDASGQRWVSATVFRELQTEFATMLQAVSFDKSWDKNILARMLAEIAAADGKVDDAEREFFHAFTGGEGMSLDELVAKPRLTAAELGETSADARGPMLLLALAVAMSDEDFAADERARIEQFAAGLGVTADALAEGERLAADYVVDQALEAAYADGTIDAAERKKVDQVAARLGVAQEQLDRLDARCRKRKGLL